MPFDDPDERLVVVDDVFGRFDDLEPERIDALS